MFCLEDINENVDGYGNHKGNCKSQNCFVHPHDLIVSTQILNLQLWSDDSSNETEN